jgi:hypothetical protein
MSPGRGAAGMAQVVHELLAVFDEADFVHQTAFLECFLGQAPVIRVVVRHQDGDRHWVVIHELGERIVSPAA